MIDKLLHEHKGLRTSLARLRALLDAADAPDAARLAAARWDLASRTMQHMASEDRHVYAVLAADPRGPAAALGRRFQDEYSRYMADYAEHLQRWPPARVSVEWARYREVALEMVDMMLVRIDREERDLFPTARRALADGQATQRSGLRWTRDAFAIKDALHAGTHG